MSQENKVFDVLSTFGLSPIESQAYIYIARHGVLTCKEVSHGLKRHTAQIYPVLKNLQAKGLVESTLEAPCRYTAISFDKIIDLSVQIKHQEALAIERERNQLLNYWMQFGQPSKQSPLERFVVIEGNRVYSKIAEMLKESKAEFFCISSLRGIIKAEELGIFGVGESSEVKIRLLTELTNENANQAKVLLAEILKAKPNLGVRKINFGKLPSRLVIKDSDELLFFVNQSDAAIMEENTCLWTNCKALVQAFALIFEDSWNNSTDINSNLTNAHPENGDNAEVSFDEMVIADRYNKALALGNRAITFLLPASGLSKLCNKKDILETKRAKGVVIRILAPITKENLREALQLLNLCEVRHVSSNYVETVLIDDSIVLQVQDGGTEGKVKFVRTNDSEYVNPIKDGLNNLWDRSRSPSSETLEFISPYGPPVFPFHPDDERKRYHNSSVIQMVPYSMVNEKDISNQCINAQKIVCNNPEREISRAYSSLGCAILHQPTFLNLPSIILQPTKVDKQSSFGEEDYILISMEDENEAGGKSETIYRHVAVAGDNPNSQQILRAIYPEANVQLLKPDEIQIRIHGNKLFAGWTVPIQLVPMKYVLPPSCIIIEGYGKVHPRAFTYISPSGFKHEVQENYFDAFVTFIHSKMQYSGSGTEGFFYRDFISTNYPPRIDRR